ncbi:MAG: SpoIIE family protein phosphatase [Myxococcota bacterium]|jgi:serine phosphatase RsbU (regulator of sigma subunit)|nr:SpoIIE family protein phosphatase [Myxococcota bacterium]
MARGKGISIGLKLAAVSTGVITLLVAMVGYLNYSEVRRAYEDAASRDQQRRLRALRDNAVVTGRRLAHSVGLALSGNDYAALAELVSSAQQDDPQCRYGRILDLDGLVMADTDPEVQRSIHEGKHQRLEEKPPEQVAIRIRCPVQVPDCPTEKLTPAAVLADVRDELTFEVSVPVARGEQRFGTIVFGYTLSQLRQELGAAQERMQQMLAASLRRALLFGALAILLGTLVAVLQGMGMTRTLQKLAHAATRIAHGDFSSRAPIVSRDEIGQLAGAFNDMAGRLEGLMEERTRQATLEKEMEVARVIQETLIPPRDLVRRGSLQFVGAFASASICGGDWWTYSDLAGGRVLVAIGDVTGHGVPSAMITAAAKSALDTLRHTTGSDLSVTYLLEEMNKTIYAAAQRKLVMTFFASIYDESTRTLTFSNAGHNFPYLIHPGGDGRPPRVGVLMTRGNRLGDDWESHFIARTATLSPGDVVVWYTDGLIEGTNPQGEAFGDRRLRRVLTELCERSPEEILEATLRAFREHQQEAALQDDITLVVARVG